MNKLKFNLYPFFNTHLSLNVMSIIFSLFALTTIIITFWTLNLGFTMRDEGWYLYLVKDQPSEVSVTKFFVFFKNVFNGDIFIERFTVFVTDICSVFIFSLGLYYYFKEKFKIKKNTFLIIFSLSILGIYLGHITVNYVFSYVTMNREIVLISLGFLLLSKCVGKNISISFSIISGYFAGNLFFVMITNTPYIILLIVFLFLHKEARYLIIWFIIGLFFSFVIYFMFFQSYESYFNDLQHNIYKTLSNGFITNHGSKFMLNWIFDTAYFFLYDVLSFVLIMFGLFYLKQAKLSIYLLFILIGFFLLYFWKNILFSDNKVATMVPFLGLLFYVFYEIATTTRITNSIFLLFIIFFASISLSFGSDTMYSVRSNYLVFILPTTFLLMLYLKNFQSYQLVLLFIITVYFFAYLTLPFRTNWAHVEYVEQKIPVSSIGINQNIKLDMKNINELNQLKEYDIKNKYVILSSMFSWGYCYLLNCKPLSYDFNFIEKTALQRVKEMQDYNEIFLVEEKNSPHFSKDFIEDISEIFEAKRIISKQTSLHNLYILMK